MENRYVSSSHLELVSYDGVDMYIRFHNGTVYKYLNVPYAVFDGLTNSDSPGSFFHAHVKNEFVCEKM